VGKDGSFVVGTSRKGDGAPAGVYAVAIAWTSPGGTVNPRTGEVPSKLAPRYSSPRLSPFRAEVKQGNNEVPAFRIER
jgi:hypothetical protein